MPLRVMAQWRRYAVIGVLAWSRLGWQSTSAACAEIEHLELLNSAAEDQDDLCVWPCSTRPDESLVIVSDKSASRLFVYDLGGALLQHIEVPKPGNIDLRQGVAWSGEAIDIVAVNQRAEGTGIRLYRVDAESRRLAPLGGHLATPPNYGGCLFYDCRASRLYFICTAEDGVCRQFELSPDEDGKPSAREVRSWTIGKCEGAVADDERGLLFVTEETRGIWMVGARPDDPTPGKLIARVGEHGITGDLEGLALSPRPQSWLIASDQGRSKYLVFETTGDCDYVGEFGLPSVGETDGLEVCAMPLGERFPGGAFGCHNGARKPCAVVLTPWDDVQGLIVRDP